MLKQSMYTVCNPALPQVYLTLLMSITPGLILQVRYTVLHHGTPVLVACNGQTYNVTYLPVPTPASPINSSVISERPFNVSLINVDRLQYLYNKSEGKYQSYF